MSKYGYSTQYADQLYGETILKSPYIKHTIRRIPLGLEVRKQLGKRVIFRRSVGNGYFESVAGKTYQHKYKYFVPSSINNPEGQAARDLFKKAMNYWTNDLSNEEKAEYTARAKRLPAMCGHNLFIREVIKGERILPDD